MIVKGILMFGIFVGIVITGDYYNVPPIAIALLSGLGALAGIVTTERTK